MQLQHHGKVSVSQRTTVPQTPGKTESETFLHLVLQGPPNSFALQLSFIVGSTEVSQKYFEKWVKLQRAAFRKIKLKLEGKRKKSLFLSLFFIFLPWNQF